LFLGCCFADNVKGAHALNIKGEVTSVEEFVRMIHEEIPESRELVSISKDAKPLKFAYDFVQSGLDRIVPNQHQTGLREGIQKIASTFRLLHQQGLLHTRDLD
jgi:hypothetical protein